MGAWGFPTDYLLQTAGATLHCARAIEAMLRDYPGPEEGGDPASVSMRTELARMAADLRQLTELVAKANCP